MDRFEKENLSTLKHGQQIIDYNGRLDGQSNNNKKRKENGLFRLYNVQLVFAKNETKSELNHTVALNNPLVIFHSKYNLLLCSEVVMWMVVTVALVQCKQSAACDIGPLVLE